MRGYQPKSHKKNQVNPNFKLKNVTKRLFVLATLLVLLFGLRATPVSAATITVCASGCDHDTIAAAITAASAGDTISLSAETFTEHSITVDKNLTITGDSAATTIVQAHAAANTAPNLGIFTVSTGVTATFEKMTLRHVYASGFHFSAVAAIRVSDNSTVTVNNSIFSNNANVTGFFGGAGISSTGTLTVNNSTFSNNSAGSGKGGAISSTTGTITINNSTFSANSAGSGGAINNQNTTVTINNSTFSGNTATSNGGAISVEEDTASTTIVNSTFSGNSAGSDGDAIHNNANMAHSSPAVLHLSNTIIVGSCHSTNTSGPGTDTNNLIQGTNTSCGSPLSTADPMLNALADNGGDTQTFALQAGSPAIDAGDNTTCADAATINNLDQRGESRPQDGDQDGTATCDIGAYELQSPLAVTLASLQAVATGEHVVVTWETVSELENLGFNLYRATALDGAQEQLNSALISAQASGSGQGAAYEWVDDTVAAGMTYYYWLADVNLNGSETMHEPVSVTINTPTAITLDSFQSTSSLPLWAFLSAGLTLLLGAWLVRRRVAG